MLGYDSSTTDGMSEFKTFIKTVERGGTGRPGRSWVPTPAPCNGVMIELSADSMDNPLHLHKKAFGNRIRKADRACTVEPTANVVKQRETYFAFKLDSNVMLAPRSLN